MPKTFSSHSCAALVRSVVVSLASAAAAAALLSAPLTAHAHRGWMLPSATVLSGNDAWVTVDAAVSNDLFYFEHQPMRLDNLVLFAPDGSPAKAENSNTGRYRSTFDVKLSMPGTYKFAVVGDGMFASFKVGTETRRVRGTAESLARDIPANATDLSVMQNISRNEIFVTAGKPSTTVFKPTGKGLELVPVTHPNDLVAGDTARFRFLLDGQPAAGINVTVIPGGIRYRDKLEEQKLVADAQGEVSVRWATPGFYWLSAAPAQAGEGPPKGGTLAAPVRRASYATTLEVLAQ